MTEVVHQVPGAGAKRATPLQVCKSRPGRPCLAGRGSNTLDFWRWGNGIAVTDHAVEDTRSIPQAL